jgi:Baseplate J-like protein
MTQTSIPSIHCPEPYLGATEQGIERVAVDDRQAQLIVTFYRPLVFPQHDYLLRPRSYSLSGGQRIFPKVLTATLPSDSPPDAPPDLLHRRVVLTLDTIGDFSIYTLTVSGADIDPFFASRKLRFRLACDDPFDCRPPAAVPPGAPELPVAIDYLAKDYASFRQALLDFIPTRLPAWTERSEADIGMMLLELFAYTADQLSYMQDRVANEAFLNTATQRRSVAGHLALIGYQMDEGASAYAWLQFQVNSDVLLPANPGLRVTNQPRRDDEPIIVFETLGPATLRVDHNHMSLYTWGNRRCCLPAGSLSATLNGQYDQLALGDYLLFDNPQTGHRDVVRLIAAPEILPARADQSPPAGPLTVVRWSAATPLRYDYCADDVIVRGNLVLATHGETVLEEALRALTDEEAQVVRTEVEARAHRPWQRIPRQRLNLEHGPLAHLDASTLALAAPPSLTPAPPAQVTDQPPRSVSTLTVKVGGETWQQQPTLLNSAADAHVYRVEIDDQGDATVVFGDDVFGRRPDETATVLATYRVGGGKIGNVAADTLTLVRPRATEHVPWLLSVTNPLPATGGRDLESHAHARRFGPATFQKPLVAVTAADYQTAAQELTLGGLQPIQRAKAAFRWTGSWLTVALVADPRQAQSLSPVLRQALLDFLETRRLAGYDLELLPPVYVPVELAIDFCTARGFQPFDVQSRLQQALSTAELPDGRKGFFHPDNFSFGDSLYVSRLYAATMAVPGVESAEITRLARLHAARPDEETATNLRQGYLAIGADQVVRLDNDRNFPENGVLTLRAKGIR